MNLGDEVRSPQPRRIRVTMGLPRDIRVSELDQFCIDNNLVEDPFIPGGHVVAWRTETPEEVADRLARMRRSDQQHRDYIERRYRELFGDG